MNPYELSQYESAQAYALSQSGREPQHPTPSEPADWQTIRKVLLWLVPVSAWAVWVFFMIIPASTGAHGLSMFSHAENFLLCGAGLVLCLAASIALKRKHKGRMGAFVVGLYLFAAWF